MHLYRNQSTEFIRTSPCSRRGTWYAPPAGPLPPWPWPACAAAQATEHARVALSPAIAMYSGMDMTFWLPETQSRAGRSSGSVMEFCQFWIGKNFVCTLGAHMPTVNVFTYIEQLDAFVVTDKYRRFADRWG